MEPKFYIVDGRSRRLTMAEANAKAAEIHRRTGVFVSITEAPAVSAARLAYQEDCRRRPTYDNGRPRVRWEALDTLAKMSWERNPTPRDWPARKD